MRVGRYASGGDARVGTADGQTIKREVQAKQSVIYAIGFGATLLISFVAAINASDAFSMIGFLLGTLVVGMVGTWLISNRLENKMTNGEGLQKYGVTERERIAVLLASLVLAAIVFNHEYGYLLSPFILVFFNGAIYLYGRRKTDDKYNSGGHAQSIQK